MATTPKNHHPDMVGNEHRYCFLTTKHSWKGKYKRVFCVGSKGIVTYNPQSLEITNQVDATTELSWPYAEFNAITPSTKAGAVPGEFTISFRNKSKKSDTMRFSSEYTAEILTCALEFRHKFCEPKQNRMRVNAFKEHWSSDRRAVTLEVGERSLQQMNQTGVIVAHYYYKDIVEFISVSDYPGGFCVCVGEHRRLHMFASQHRDDLMSACNATAIENIGIGIKVSRQTITHRDFCEHRFGKCGSDLHLTSLTEYTVQKQAVRHESAVRRLFCITQYCVVERDPASYMPVTLKQLTKIHQLIRSEQNPQLFQIAYQNGDLNTYYATERDTILATLLDGVRSSGNIDVHVRANNSDRSMRLVPHNVFLDEDAESLLLRNIIAVPPGQTQMDMMKRFNANIPYSGLVYSVTQEIESDVPKQLRGIFSENKERLITNCLNAVTNESSNNADVVDMESQFQCLHRLFASKAGFHAFTNVPQLREKLGNKVVIALKLNSEAVNHSAIDMLCALMQPMHNNYELRQEQMNKNSLLSSEAFLEHLLAVLSAHVKNRSGTLVISSMLDFLTYALCAPYSETTSGDKFDVLLSMVAQRARSFYYLFQFPSLTIVKGAGLVMRAIIEESTADVSSRMQNLALSDGAFLRHLHSAMFTQGKDIRQLTTRQLSRQLLAIWTTENQSAEALLSKIFPCGLLSFMHSTEQPPATEEDVLLGRNNLTMAETESASQSNAVMQQVNEVQRVVEKHLDVLLQHWKLRKELNMFRKDEKQQRPVVLRKRRQRIKCTLNWKMFAYQFARDHSKGDLIWNHKTREELRESLEAELRALTMDKELATSANVSWNYTEFEVLYPSLNDEVRIGDYYLRNLLDEENQTGTPTDIAKPKEFFNEVYHHWLVSSKKSMRVMCLQSMAVVYGRHHADIGVFTDLKYMLHMLQTTRCPFERDHLLILISKLVVNKDNVHQLVTHGGVLTLIEFLPLSHLHVSRAVVPSQTNVIEASPDQSRDGAKEWYYTDGKAETGRQGPFSLTELRGLYEEGSVTEQTKCWASGLDGWRALGTIPQLLWTFVITEKGKLNESQLAVLCLDALVTITQFFPSRDADDCVIRPLPRVKKYLSQPAHLAHVVQLLLTFDPAIVERTASLLYLVMQDNPHLPRLYLTGVFYFILMYTGSNVLPIARFLHYCHLKQAFKSDVAKSDMIQRSVLSPILPEATIYYLENYGPEKFAEIFLGEHDNPEVIWNSEMRRHLISRLAAHISDYSVRLASNTRAIYQYCPIAPIEYAQLEDELFCNIYYLRHLCDTVRFPDWTIKDPVEFVKSCLASWYSEIDRKPDSLTVEQACQMLQIKPQDLGENNEAIIRKAYFKLAQKYHPDKNSEGREMFEAINTAYEFLCSKSNKRTMSGPDSNKILLCIRAQSIVYETHTQVLSPFKYAGYGLLIRTITLETDDDGLFGSEVPLLSASIELCHHTLAASALNAEQLRRENGLQAVQRAFNRCVSVLSTSCKPTDLSVQVCLHACRVFATAARFDASRAKLAEMPQLFDDICRVLRFNNATKMAVTACECIQSMAVDNMLQTLLFQAGVLWRLLPNMFKYDYTLDEGGVSKTENTNTQHLMNNLARVSCDACAALAGYREDCPDHDGVQNALRAMLTPYLLRVMSDMNVDHTLKLMNSNNETPELIWDNGTRAEMLKFVELNADDVHATYEQRAVVLAQTNTPLSVDPSELFGAEFTFTALRKELVIGDVYVRVYNEQPTFSLSQPKQFCADLLEFVGRVVNATKGKQVNGHVAENGVSDDGMTSGKHNAMGMAMQALVHVLKANPGAGHRPGIELMCIGHFSMLFTYLTMYDQPQLLHSALQVISLASNNTECVADMAASNCVHFLAMLIAALPEATATVISTLLSLSSNSKIVKLLLESGCLLYLLNVFTNSNQLELRTAAAELISKLQSDKLTGPRWTRSIQCYLPCIFADAMRDSPMASVSLFDSETENPELIWTEAAKMKVKSSVITEMEQWLTVQTKNPNTMWKMPTTVVYANELSGSDLVVAGVYVQLYIAQPSWMLRAPRQFLTELLQLQLNIVNKFNNDITEKLETVTTALTLFMQHQAAMVDQVASMGYVPQLVEAMQKSTQPPVARSLLLVVYHLAASQQCIDAFTQVETVGALMTAMKQRPDLLHSAGHTLRRVFTNDNDLLTKQAVDCKLVEYLLVLMGSPLRETEQPASVKAEFAATLKSLARNLTYGAAIQNVLDSSKVWKEFKDQDDRLFLQRAPEVHAITAGTAATANYLTQGLATATPTVVPPPPEL